jgi:methylenetetrahydrofolate reductase (NADH)
MTMAPIAAASLLKQHGFEPILQITGRDRNRIAIQGDMLAASALGVQAVLCMGGDPPGAGDHPDAKPVFDLDTIAIIQAAASLVAGKDMYGHELKGNAAFMPGAVANPGAPDLEKELTRMEEKIEAGARFFQTQAVYDVKAFEAFMKGASKLKVPVIAGHIVLKSGDMARRLNATLPGVAVPETLIDELDSASDKPAKSIEIGGRLISQLKESAGGVHVMAIGWEARIPAILEAGGVERAAA